MKKEFSENKKNQIEILKLRTAISEIKNSLTGYNSRLVTRKELAEKTQCPNPARLASSV